MGDKKSRKSSRGDGDSSSRPRHKKSSREEKSRDKSRDEKSRDKSRDEGKKSSRDKSREEKSSKESRFKAEQKKKKHRHHGDEKKHRKRDDEGSSSGDEASSSRKVLSRAENQKHKKSEKTEKVSSGFEPVTQLNWKKPTASKFLENAVDNHVESFNLFMNHVLPVLPQEVAAVEVAYPEETTTQNLKSKAKPKPPSKKPSSGSDNSEENSSGSSDENSSSYSEEEENTTPITSSGLRLGLASLSLAPPKKRDCLSLPKRGRQAAWPTDCREGHFTYAGALTAAFYVDRIGADQQLTASASASSLKGKTASSKTLSSVLGGNTSKASASQRQLIKVELGNIPVMVGSKACHLHNKTPAQKRKMGEDESERGGYFIMNGNERIIRLLIMAKSNHLIAMERPSYQNRGPLYTDKAVSVRCMKRDMTTLTNTLHYLRDGTCTFRFSYKKQEFLLPFLLVAFACAPESVRDRELAAALCGADASDDYVSERVMTMQQQNLGIGKCEENFSNSSKTRPLHTGVHSKHQALAYLGRAFAEEMGSPPWTTDAEDGLRLVHRFILPHLNSHTEKFQMLLCMFHKLMGVARGRVKPENCDALSTQEALLPGQLYGAVLKEALEANLEKVAPILQRKMQLGDSLGAEEIERVFYAVKDVDHAMNYFMATGTVRSRGGLDLMQTTGFTIVADKLNAVRYH